MMKRCLSAATAAVALCAFAAAPGAKVTLDLVTKGHDVPKSLYGIFFEDINWGADGGLSPEMLANGGFNWLQADHEKWNCREDGWEPDFRDGGMARLSFQYGSPVHPNTAKHLRIESFGAGLAGVRNRGMDGMWFANGEMYRLSFDWREVRRSGVDYELGKWNRFDSKFAAEGEKSFDFPFGIVKTEPDAKSADSRWTLSILVKGRRTVEFDNVTLKPVGPKLVRAGMRKDLVDRLAALKPAFVRFPGGCIVEEGDFQHWYDWRRTVGPKERRECVLNRWVRPDAPYWETFDIGFYEYFVLCEELGAEPLPICLSGLTCQYQKPAQLCAVEDADIFAGVILELIEFANGGADTLWGKVRSEMGHPAPFNLKMVGIGNENWDKEFFDRYEPIVKVVREKHPEIKIVGSSGPGPEDGRFKYAWNRITKDTADFVDEHYYMPPEWFLKSAKRYDGYDRVNKPLVYAGEYACHHRIGGKKVNTLWSAVCEAAAMTGFERNSDVVRMASYAPLFAREGHDQWSPDLIWFSGTESWGSPNYYVQQLFMTNRPDRIVPSTEVVAGGNAEDPGFFHTCGYDADAGEVVVKCVNASEEPRELTLDFGNTSLHKGEIRRIELSGACNDQNTRENPNKCSPVSDWIPFAGGHEFKTTIKPTSLTVFRIKAS